VEFALPTVDGIDNLFYNPIAPAGLLGEEEEEGITDVQPQGSRMTDVCDTTEVCLGPPTGLNDLTPIYFGERINSIRQLVKRSTIYTEELSAATINASTYTLYGSFYVPSYPFPKGMMGAQNWTPMSWYAQGFLAVRGAVRYKVIATSPALGHDSYLNSMAIRRYAKAPAALALGSSNMTWYQATTSSIPAAAVLGDTWMGVNESGADQIQEFELPYCCPYKFLPAPFPNVSNRVAGVGMTGTSCSYGQIRVGPVPIQSTTTIVRMSNVATYVSAGEDYSLTWFVCGPVVEGAS
jgi:hypothetical protein